MKIIVDMMGGDNAPLAVLEGAAAAVKEYGVQLIGVGAKPRPDYDLADWVLGKFPPDDAKALADRCPDIAAAAKLIMDGKLGLAQSKYNG